MKHFESDAFSHDHLGDCSCVECVADDIVPQTFKTF